MMSYVVFMKLAKTTYDIPFPSPLLHLSLPVGKGKEEEERLTVERSLVNARHSLLLLSAFITELILEAARRLREESSGK